MSARKARLVRPFAAAVACTLLWSAAAVADEGGASFWLPGQFGSLAAVPVEPGWSLGAVYYHSSVSANGSKDFEIGGRIVAGLDARADMLFLVPTYTFVSPVLAACRTFVSGNLNYTELH